MLRRKSPKHQKHFSEDIRKNQTQKSPLAKNIEKHNDEEEKNEAELAELIRRQLYQGNIADQIPEEDQDEN